MHEENVTKNFPIFSGLKGTTTLSNVDVNVEIMALNTRIENETIGISDNQNVVSLC